MMLDTHEPGEMTKAMKVVRAAVQLSDEYAAERNIKKSKLVRGIIDLPTESLARLHDIIVTG